MALDRKSIDFLSANTVYDFASWDLLLKSSVLANTATIGSKGYVGCKLDPQYNSSMSAAKYRQISLTIFFNPSEEWNYTNELLEVNIKELYGTNNNSNVYENTRTIAFTQDDLIEDGDGDDKTWTLRRTYPTENKGMQDCEIYIINRTLNTVNVQDIKLQRSSDISEGQLGDMMNSMNDATTPTSFKVYVDSETQSYINGLGVIIPGGLELKYKPIFEGGRLNSIETNFGAPISVVYIPEVIDTSTTDDGSEET